MFLYKNLFFSKSSVSIPIMLIGINGGYGNLPGMFSFSLFQSRCASSASTGASFPHFVGLVWCHLSLRRKAFENQFVLLRWKEKPII